MEIYADVLFIVNLSMDFLTLYLTGRIARRPLRPGRLLLASAIGGLYGVAALFWEGYPLIGAAIQLAMGLLLCYLAFGRPIMGPSVLFIGLSCLLGGGVSAIWSAFGRGDPSGGGEMGAVLPRGVLPAAVLICAVLALIAAGVARRRSMAGEAELTLMLEGRRLCLRGILDSAHFLTEPLSGLPVILIPTAMGRALLGEALYGVMAKGGVGDILTLPRPLALRLRPVRTAGVGGERLLVAVRLDRCEVEGRECAAYLALCELPQALIPADL